MRICDAPPELFEIIKLPEQKKNSLPDESLPITKTSILSDTVENIPKNSATIISPDKRQRIRKNPYPII